MTTDDANGGMSMSQPTCIITIEFDRGRPWIYPLALNGRTVGKVTIGGVEYAPKAES